jgi:hypothetical protein
MYLYICIYIWGRIGGNSTASLDFNESTSMPQNETTPKEKRIRQTDSRDADSNIRDHMSPFMLSPSGRISAADGNNEIHHENYNDNNVHDNHDNYNVKSNLNLDVNRSIMGHSDSQMNIKIPSLPLNYYDNVSPTQHSDSREQRLESRSRRIDQVRALIYIFKYIFLN